MADTDATSVEELKQRIERLEAENEALRAAESGSSPRSGRGRSVSATLLAIVAAVLIALSVPALWLNRMVTDTDVYVRTVAPLAQDADIQNAVAAAASDAIVERLDAANRIRQLLPEELKIVAAPVAEAVNGFIEKQSLVLVRSEGFADTWEALNRASHKALVAAVTGRDTGAVGVEKGVISLDVGELADQLKGRLQVAGFDLAANIPTGAIDRQIVLYRSPVLASLTSAIDTITRVSIWLPLVGLALVGVALAIGPDRRRVVLWLGGALAIGAVLPLQALFFGQTYVVRQMYELASIPSPAAQSAFEIIFRDLVSADRATAVLGFVLWLGAVVAGPARWAVAARSGLQGGMSGMASHLELGRFGEWVATRKSALRWVGAAVVFVILMALPAPRTPGSIVWIAGLFALWVLLVELFGSSPVAAVAGDSATGASGMAAAEDVASADAAEDPEAAEPTA